MKMWMAVAAVLGCLLLVACGTAGGTDGAASISMAEPSAPSEPPSDDATSPANVQACADVIEGNIQLSADGTFRISATVRSGDTGWEKYADSWEVHTPEGKVIDVRVLTHPHEDEQPFTRSLSGVTIAPNVEEVTLAAHDLVNGFCGETFTLDVPR